MENENPAPVGADHSWNNYLLIVILIIGSIVALQIGEVVVGLRDRTGPGPGSTTSVMQGDFYVKWGLAVGGKQKEQYYRQAIDLYKDAAPSPGAYRRIGVVRETLLNENAWSTFQKIDSKEATSTFSAKKVKEYHSEVQLWRDIYGPGSFDKSKVDSYVSRIEKLNLGPLKDLAISDVYRKAGNMAKANARDFQARRLAENSVYPFLAALGWLTLVGLAGLILAVLFLVNYGRQFDCFPRPSIQHSVLFLTFLAYFISYLVFGIVVAAIIDLAGVDASTPSGALVGALLQLGAMVGSYAIGLSALWKLTSYTGEDAHGIGYVKMPLGSALTWGVGGFAALLPFWGVALLISNIIFRNVPTPENQVVEYLTGGSPATMAVTIFMAVVAAPIIEETFFRGALYGALRARMSVWGAAVLSAALFASIHPLPGHFLPILAIGTVFALIREKTGSLIPCMICHGLYNGVILLLALTVY